LFYWYESEEIVKRPDLLHGYIVLPQPPIKKPARINDDAIYWISKRISDAKELGIDSVEIYETILNSLIETNTLK